MLKYALGIATAGTVGFFIGRGVNRDKQRADIIRRSYLCRKSLVTCPAYCPDPMAMCPMPDERDYALEEMNQMHPELLYAIASGDYAVEYVDKTKTPRPVVLVPCDFPIDPWSC